MSRKLNSAADIDKEIERLIQQKEQMKMKKVERFKRKLLTKDISDKIINMDDDHIDAMVKQVKKYWDGMYNEVLNPKEPTAQSDAK